MHHGTSVVLGIEEHHSFKRYHPFAVLMVVDKLVVVLDIFLIFWYNTNKILKFPI